MAGLIANILTTTPGRPLLITLRKARCPHHCGSTTTYVSVLMMPGLIGDHGDDEDIIDCHHDDDEKEDEEEIDYDDDDYVMMCLKTHLFRLAH